MGRWISPRSPWIVGENRGRTIQRCGDSDGKALSKMENVVVKLATQGGCPYEERLWNCSGRASRPKGALNSMLDTIKLDVQTKLDHFIAELTALCDEVKDVKGDWALCKEVVLNKTRTPKEPKC
ncbi:hypothetical protein L3X38_025868 [Prunus dulcis]|uniref:Uncharacterized protein n=1 Tax=Prunus dulcis TaxID=3755 RepID=A0AAD4W451_PRUDU|nr:hypothetical protein L3X38_025868 [Prunus dulcis]